MTLPGKLLQYFLFALLSSFSLSNGALRKGKLGNGLKNAISDLTGGCPIAEAPLIRNQTSPNGDSPTESLMVMVKHAGYKAEQMTVETSDGYYLSMYRITKPNTNVKKNKDLTPVLIVHGLLSSPADFLMHDKNKALPYKLVDSGRDVFLAANRGTTYSRKHKTYGANDPRYWGYSFIELGLYDMPAFLDKIKELTKQPQVFYIGHSLGSKQFFSAMSEFPDRCSRIKGMWALAPVAHIKNVKSPILKALSLVAGPVGTGTSVLGKLEFLPTNPTLKKAQASVCSLNVGCIVCQQFLFLLGGINPKQFNLKWQSQQLGHFPDTTSSQELIHEAQGIFYNRFGYFNFGPIENKKKYGSIIPKKLNPKKLAKSTCSINLWYAKGDWLSVEKDVIKLKKELGKAVKTSTLIEMKEFNHFDFLYAKNADTIVYDVILKQMDSYK